MKKWFSSALVILVILGLMGAIYVTGEFKSLVTKTNVLEKLVIKEQKSRVKEFFKNNGFNTGGGKEKPLMRIISHTYMFNPVKNKEAPTNPYMSLDLKPILFSRESPLVIVGDFIWRETQEDLIFLDSLKSERQITFIKGNHETKTKVDKMFRDNFIEDFGTIKLLGLTLRQNPLGALEGEKEAIRFINEKRQEIERGEGEKLVVCIHHNIFSDEIYSNLPYQEKLSLREAIFSLNPNLIVIGDGGDNLQDPVLKFGDTFVAIVGFPYLDASQPPVWLDLYDEGFVAKAIIGKKVFGKPINY